MNKSYNLQNPSSWTMAVFGGMAFILGIVGIIWPDALLIMMRFESLEPAMRLQGDYTLTFITASSIASLNMGAYYLLAAFNNLQVFYRWTVPFRILTFTVFTVSVIAGRAPVGFIGVAVWELAGAIATGLALSYEKKQELNIVPALVKKQDQVPNA